MRRKLTAEDAENAENTDPFEDPWRSVSSVVNVLCLLAMVLLASRARCGSWPAILRPGTRIVSHHFAMGDRWLPDETRDVNGLEIFLWRVP